MNENPFIVKTSRANPNYSFLAIREAKITFVAPVETKTSSKTGEQYKMTTVNLQITIPGAARFAYLNARVMYADAEMLEQGAIKQGDTISCLLDFDTHSFNGRTYQDINISELTPVGGNA